MGVIIPQVITPSKASGAQIIDGSLKFNGSQYLTRTPSSAGNRNTWTWSGWIKRSQFGDWSFFAADGSSSDTLLGFYNSTKKLYIVPYAGVGGATFLSDDVFRDCGAFFHVCIALDTTQATNTNRLKAYVNGVELTWSSSTYPSQNDNWNINIAGEHRIGASTQNNSYIDGSLSQIYFIDGQALTADSFGFTDPLTNTWRPKKFSGRFVTGQDFGLEASDIVSTTGFQGGEGADKVIDSGDFAANRAHTTAGNAGETLTVTFSPAVTVSESLKVFAYLTVSGDNEERRIRVNGGSWFNPSSTADALHDLSFTGSLSTIQIEYNGSVNSRSITMRGIVIDGDPVVVSGGETGENSFYLPFDGNSPIGQDKSGNGNDFAPVNFGGSLELDNPNVSGARPILNTTQGGTQAGVGVFGSKENKIYVTTTANGSVYQFDITSGDNPSLEFIRGATYKFDYSSHSSHPVLFSSTNPDSSTTAYTTGTSTSGNVISFTVPHDAPDTLYYYCVNHPTAMNGAISVTTDETKADKYASNCTLALPLFGNSSDVSNSVNCTSLTKSVSNTGVEFLSESFNFYTESAKIFDTDKLNVTESNSDFTFGTSTDFTIECWTLITSGHYYGRIIEIGTVNNNAFVLDGDGPGGHTTFRLRFDYTGSTAYSSYGIVLNKWHHVAAVRNSGTLTFYIDGIASGTADLSSSNLPGGNAQIGNYLGSNLDYDGYMQDLRVYKGVAKYTSDFVVSATSPDILPDTPSGVSGSSKLTKITDGAVSFDGTGDYLNVGSSSDYTFGTGDYTIEMFVYHTSISGQQTYFSDAFGNSAGVYFYKDSNHKLGLYYSGQIATGNTNIVSNKWTHIAISRTGGTSRLFQDGILVGSGSDTTDLTATQYYIADSASSSGEMFGFISNVRVIKGTALYTSNFTPPTSPLTNVTNTKLLCCQSPTSAAIAAVTPNVPGSGLNNGTIWSTYVTTTQGTNSRDFYSGSVYPASNLFDGTLSTVVYGGWIDDVEDASDLVFSPPSGISVSSKLEVYVGYYDKIKVNGSTYNTGGQSTAQDWVTVSDGSNFTGTLTELILENSTNTNVVRAAAIKIDDSTILLDPVTANGDAVATNFNPFNTNINTVRGRNTGYATWNALLAANSSATFSNGNLDASSSGNSWKIIRVSIGVRTGKWYVEFTTSGNNMFGLDSNLADGGRQYFNTGAGNIAVRTNNGTTFIDGVNQGTTGSAISDGSTVGLALDLDSSTKTLKVYINGSLDQTINLTSNFDNTEVLFAAALYGTATIVLNCGQKPFKFSPPDGFQPLNNANVRPETVITRPDQYVGVVTYTGSAPTAQQITGLNFGTNPDFVWVKNYSDATGYHHGLFDTVRGANKVLRSSSNGAEGTTTQQLMSFDHNGFTVGTNSDSQNYVNLSADGYVAWSWRAGGSKNTFNIDDVGYANASDVNMSVGSIRSAATNSAQTWSNNITTTGNSGSWWPTYPATHIFDADTSNYGHPNGNGGACIVTLSFSPAITCNLNVSFFGGLTGSGTGTISINGGTAVALTSGSSATTITTVDFSGSISSIVLTKTSTGAEGLLCYGFEIDGNRLTDNTAFNVPNVPSIANTGASVGTKQGFSIVKYTGNSTANATLSHGLSEAPNFVMIKNLSNAYGWVVLHTSAGTTGTILDGSLEYYMLQLDSSAALQNFSADTIWNPTSTTVKIDQTGGADWVNNSNSNYIMYAWHDVPGLQKFGEYQGNGSADGTFVELGFRPAIVIVKFAGTSGSASWFIYDSARGTFNPNNASIMPDRNLAQENSYDIDFLSNGFKLRYADSAGYTNYSAKYVYMAWAESPTVNLFGGGSNAR